MPPPPANLFADLPRSTVQNEQFCELLTRPGLRIERIVSTGQCSPPDFWYDQDEGEWIVLLQGAAGLRFADEAAVRDLRAGDCLDIAAHRRHRVEWTAADQVTVWLAVFYAA
jgi:cupin 2 domain-containing protein